MTPETEAFLARVREAEGPPAGASARVLESVRTAVAAPASAAATTTGLGAKMVLKLGGWIAGVMAASLALQPAAPAHPVSPARELRTASPSMVAAAELPAAVAPEVPPVAVPAAPPARPRQTPSLQAELALLAEVHVALRRGDGADALRRLDAHRTRDRRLAVERSAARVFALCAAGRRAEAQLAAAEFVRRHPSAAQRAAVERACADRSHHGFAPLPP